MIKFFNIRLENNNQIWENIMDKGNETAYQKKQDLELQDSKNRLSWHAPVISVMSVVKETRSSFTKKNDMMMS